MPISTRSTNALKIFLLTTTILVYFFDFIRKPRYDYGLTGMDLIFGRSIPVLSGPVAMGSNLWAIGAMLFAILGNWLCLTRLRRNGCLFLNACAGMVCLMLMQIEYTSGYLQPLGVRMAAGYWIAFWAFGAIGMLDYLDSQRKTKTEVRQIGDKKLVINLIAIKKRQRK